jgi:hypothetical protein
MEKEMTKISVDRSLKALGIDAVRALRILNAHIKRVKKERERARRKYVHKRDGEVVDRALLV